LDLAIQREQHEEKSDTERFAAAFRGGFDKPLIIQLSKDFRRRVLGQGEWLMEQHVQVDPTCAANLLERVQTAQFAEVCPVAG